MAGSPKGHWYTPDGRFGFVARISFGGLPLKSFVRRRRLQLLTTPVVRSAVQVNLRLAAVNLDAESAAPPRPDNRPNESSAERPARCGWTKLNRI